MKLEKIEYQKLQIGSVIQAKKDGKVYYVDGLLPKITIVENGNPNNCRELSISTLTRYYQLVVPEAVEVEEQPEETVQEVASTQVIEQPVTTTTSEPKTVQVKVSTEPKRGGKKKLTDEQYLNMVEDYLKGLYATKKAVSEAYNVDPAMVSDALSVKYCRKRVALQVERLKSKYNYSK